MDIKTNKVIIILISFIVKGKIKYLKVENNRNKDGKHLNSILYDDSSEIEVVAFNNCDEIYKQLCVNIFIIIYYLIYVDILIEN